jgi:hypothetical protein
MPQGLTGRMLGRGNAPAPNPSASPARLVLVLVLQEISAWWSRPWECSWSQSHSTGCLHVMVLTECECSGKITMLWAATIIASADSASQTGCSTES